MEGSMGVPKATAAAIAGAFLIALSVRASAIKIKKTELPEAVRQTVDREAPGAHVAACWRIPGDRDALYEIDLKENGRKKGLVIAGGGELLTVQEEVTFDDLPRRVQERFRRMAGDHDIEEVHSIWQHDEIVGYGARIDGDDGEFDVEVGPRGESSLRGEAPSRIRESWRERAPTPTP
jgi:hypothetical protein